MDERICKKAVDFIRGLGLDEFPWKPDIDECQGDICLVIVEYQYGPDKNIYLDVAKHASHHEGEGNDWYDHDDGWVGPLRGVLAWCEVQPNG